MHDGVRSKISQLEKFSPTRFKILEKQNKICYYIANIARICAILSFLPAKSRLKLT